MSHPDKLICHPQFLFVIPNEVRDLQFLIVILSGAKDLLSRRKMLTHHLSHLTKPICPAAPYNPARNNLI